MVDDFSNPEIRVYRKVDFSNCYFSIPVAPESQVYLAFSYPGGQVCPTTLPQGLGAASQTCAAAVKIIFGPIPAPNPEPSLFGENFKAYQDNLFPCHVDFDSHFDFLAQHLFPRLLWSLFSISFPKLELFMDRIKGIGILFQAGGRVSILPDRVEKINQWPTPTSQTEVRAFLGGMGICRRWVKNYAEKARPMTRLTGKAAWKWRAEVEGRSFELVKTSVVDHLQLYVPRPGAACVVYSRAATRSGGVVILQSELGKPISPAGSRQRASVRISGLLPILFDSVTFNPTVQRYSLHKREMWTLVHFLTKYRHLVNSRDKPSIICTADPQMATFPNSDHQGIFARWAVFLESVHMEFRLVKESQMGAAQEIAEAVFGDNEVGEDAVCRLGCEAEGREGDVSRGNMGRREAKKARRRANGTSGWRKNLLSLPEYSQNAWSAADRTLRRAPDQPWS